MATSSKKASEKPKILGVVFHEITSGFFSLVMTGIDLEAFKAGYQLLITVAKPESPDRQKPYEMLKKAKIDGLIVLDVGMEKPLIQKLKAKRRPLVLIQNPSPDPDVSSVVPDNEGGAYLAMNHLLSLGYDKILVIAGAPAVEDSDLRMRGCQRALAEKGKTLNDVGVIVGYYNAQEAVHGFRNYRERHGLPRAIFAFNDDMALAILKEFRQEGIKVPEDVAVVGFDGIDASDLMGLTTVKVPMVEVGKEAVRLAVQRIENRELPPDHVVKETTLLVRDSCGALRKAD